MPNPEVEHQAWYDRDTVTDAKVHEHLIPTVRSIEDEQYEVHKLNLLNAMLYSNRELQALDWGEGGLRTVEHRPASLATENLVQSICDTGMALIGSTRPKPTIVTKGAEFSDMLKGRQLDKFLYAEFQFLDIYQKLRRMFLDAEVFGTGALYMDVDMDSQEVVVERVMPDEIIVDQTECLTSTQPRNLYWRRLVSRLELLELYGDTPEAVKAITDAQTKEFTWTGYRTPPDDLVVVVDAWHLGSPGQFSRVIDGYTLEDDEYTEPDFPFVFFRWSDPLSGFYGQSLVEQVLPYQARSNELNDVIRRSQEIASVLRIGIPLGQGITEDFIETDIGQMFYFRDRPPEPLIWPAVSAELYAERDRNRKAAFEFVGFSELSSQAKLPAGIESAPAQREYIGIEQKRFATQEMRWESAVMELGERLIGLYARLYTETGVNRKSAYRTRDLVEMIDWADVDMPRDRYVVQVEASSLLTMSPAARRQQATEWAQAGVITPDEFKLLLGHPDLEKTQRLVTASLENIEYAIDKMLKGEPQQPDPLQNLVHGATRVHQMYLRLEYLEAPEEIMQLFRNWIEGARDLVRRGQGTPPGQDLQSGLQQAAPPPPPTPATSNAAAQGLAAPFAGTGSAGSPLA